MRNIVVKEYDDSYKSKFKSEAKLIKDILGSNLIEVHHIGSTSVVGLKSKPIIDIRPVVKDIEKVDLHNAEFEKLGYECMGEFGITGRRFFKKGGEEDRPHHIHIFQVDNEKDILRHLAFRDYLRENEKARAEYGNLKEELAKRYPNDIESYMDGKNEFIKELEEKSKK
ncbi:GrpB family protein [Miniphocaeibacter massiliensis]|uniref:GrpB family protein n=1 Tax=Miniphocaeibacter massiliensis TaxID=2041841 RepID=UPI000C1C48D1|nr:GrpB family protein [Miniphocaeibacter massiliensis]